MSQMFQTTQFNKDEFAIKINENYELMRFVDNVCETLNEKLKIKNNWNTIVRLDEELEIIEIDKIPVYIRLESHSHIIKYEIHLKNVSPNGDTYEAYYKNYCMSDFEDNRFSMCYVSLNIFNYTLKHLKFNIRNSKFEIKNKIQFPIKKFTRNNNNITKKVCDECVVCYENTNFKTACNHTLCAICWGKIKEKCDCCCGNNCHNSFKSCPICREDIEYGESECESDDE
jgi:hypothetical protein